MRENTIAHFLWVNFVFGAAGCTATALHAKVDNVEMALTTAYGVMGLLAGGNLLIWTLWRISRRYA